MNYHNIPTIEWRKEQPDLDRSIEHTIEQLYDKEITLGHFEMVMTRLLSACKVLNRNKTLSDLAFDNYLHIYVSVKNSYEAR